MDGDIDVFNNIFFTSLALYAGVDLIGVRQKFSHNESTR